MKSRFQTDFLCPNSGFLVGMGSVMNLSGGYYHYNASENPDALAMAADWFITGQDIADALKVASVDPSFIPSRKTCANERRR